MLIILSPAKKQMLTATKENIATSKINFLKETQTLVGLLKKYKTQDLQQLMSISAALAKLNSDRFLEYDLNFNNPSKAAPAVTTFQGDAYKTLNAADFTNDDAIFCQNNMAIISGLYGALNPYDMIQEYRLEMKTNLPNPNGSELYIFWGNKIANFINNKLKSHDNKTIINLASVEYSKAIDKKELKHPIINIEFKEKHNGEYKTIGIYAKKARGLMARFIIKNRITIPFEITKFNENGYIYSKNLSEENKFVFTRGQND